MKPQIMLVDDEPGVLALVSALLKRNGFGAITAANASAALKLLETVTPDLFILDIMMPGVNGIELCRQIRALAAGADKPIVMLSARDDADTVNASYAAGANAYITKLTIHRQLLDSIRDLLSVNDHAKTG